MSLQWNKEDTEKKQSASVCTKTKNPCSENKSCIQTFIRHWSNNAIFIILITRIDHCYLTFIIPPLWTLTLSDLPLLLMCSIHSCEGRWVNNGPLITPLPHYHVEDSEPQNSSQSLGMISYVSSIGRTFLISLFGWSTDVPWLTGETHVSWNLKPSLIIQKVHFVFVAPGGRSLIFWRNCNFCWSKTASAAFSRQSCCVFLLFF